MVRRDEVGAAPRPGPRRPLPDRIRKCARMTDSAWMTTAEREPATRPVRPRILERWQSGRMYLTRNQAYCKVPWVRIPPSPPGSKQRRALGPVFHFCAPGCQASAIAVADRHGCPGPPGREARIRKPRPSVSRPKASAEAGGRACGVDLSPCPVRNRQLSLDEADDEERQVAR